jgi:hypothetical protein
MKAPPLPPYCNSWVIVSRETGRPVMETTSRRIVERINGDRYEVMSAVDFLHRFNARVGARQ